jgi:hypothetical protein
MKLKIAHYPEASPDLTDPLMGSERTTMKYTAANEPAWSEV